MSEDSIRLDQRWRRGDFELQIDIEIPGRGVTAIFGRSGSGKTSLLRCVAGLEPDCIGRVQIRGDCWQDKDSFVPTHKRPLGYVIQTPNLFPHLDVRGNLEFACRRAPAGSLPFAIVVDMLALTPLLNRYPERLSGGERQRVAIARALLIGPQLLLLDEPMASLDSQSKKEIMPYLERLHRELDLPIIYVSHSAEEVARLADHLVVMEAGRVVGQGMLGEMLSRLDFPIRLEDDASVVWEGLAVEQDEKWHLVRVATPGGEVWVRGSSGVTEVPIRLRILARDVSLALSHHDDSSILNILPGEVEEIAVEPGANSALVRVRVNEAALLARLTLRSVEHLGLASGKRVWAQIKSAALVT